MSYCLGIVSWLPDNIDDRNKRIDRLNRLLESINSFFPRHTTLIIAQNWKDYNPPYKKLNIYKYDKLGILKARKELRKRFLESNYNYLVMFDDDAIIEGDPSEFISGMENNKKGFAFREGENGEILPSQLNLFAISRYLYEKEDMVNFDPQTNEGFEDNIFTNLLKYKYPDLQWHFTGLYDIHFKNPNINKLGGEVPSTWAGNRHDWLRLRYNTEYALKRISEGCFDISKIRLELGLDKYIDPQKVDFDIDLVFPYVNNNESVWKKSFQDYCKSKGLYSKLLTNADIQRYDDAGFLKYMFRSIAENMPWIRKIHLIVSNIEQVPSWLDQTKVNIVLHKDIIPPKFLPTFNSTTIEMYLRRIPDLSEHFIYANDDMYFLNKLEKEDFFNYEGIPKCSFLAVPMKKLSSQFDRVCWNNYHHVLDALGLEDTDKNNAYRPDHKAIPYRKSTVNTVCEMMGETIFSKISTFRTNSQHNQYIYNCYEKIKNTILPDSIKFKYTTTKEPVNYLIDLINSEYQIVCINDVAMNNRYLWKSSIPAIKEAFNRKFPNKSKYEVI